MKAKIKKYEEYLKDVLNYHVDNDHEEEMLTIQDALIEFQQLFGLEEKSENSN